MLAFLEPRLARARHERLPAPAGKLAIAEHAVTIEADVQELERAGCDAVIVRAEDVSPLVGDAPPAV